MSSPIRIDVVDRFFDRQKVIEKIGRDNARRLSKIGAFIRTRAKTDILRRRKGISSPGRPPSVHSRDSFRTLKNILFAVDASWESVIIGPVAFRGANPLISGSQTVPNLLEFGGSQTIIEQSRDGLQWVRASKKKNDRYRYRKRTARYKARPFMGPALQKEIDAGTLIGVFARVVS